MSAETEIDERLRCKCETVDSVYGCRCWRQATQEDGYCDSCRTSPLCARSRRDLSEEGKP